MTCRFAVASLLLLQAFLVSARSAIEPGSLVSGTAHLDHKHATRKLTSKAKAHVEDKTQAKSAKRARRSSHEETDSTDHSTCTDLVNHGTHFTVEIEVGTPGQKFDVVADTGSDAVMVPSCACVKAGFCNAKSRCFQGTNRSSTFAIKDGPDGPPSIRMMFGSGPVQAVVASDKVRVGKLHTKMNDGILLMTDQLLNIQGQFEGILGLGLPSTDAKKGLYSTDSNDDSQAPSASSGMNADSQNSGSKVYAKSQSHSEYMQGAAQGTEVEGFMNSYDDIIPPGIGGMMTEDIEDKTAKHNHLTSKARHTKKDAAQEGRSLLQTSSFRSAAKVSMRRPDMMKLNQPAPNEEEEATNSSDFQVRGFMEEAGTDRFSLCFNDGTNGVLRLGTPKVKNAHASIGQVHWGLDFRGISVGDLHAEVQFCKPDNMTKGQQTPCGAIPDSGTTALMAPKDQLIMLYESICDRWDRCKKNYTAMVQAADDAKEVVMNTYHTDPFHIAPASKAMVFQQLVLECRLWLTKDEGLDELPEIHFHIGGANGTKQSLSLAGWSYIIETQEKEFKYIYKNVPGLGKIPVGKNFTGTESKVCSPAFSPMEYNTKENGPVWILGTPIFYEYQVGYDMGATPPEISFSNSTCGSCGGAKKTSRKAKASLMSEQVSTHSGGRRVRRLRRVDGPLRKPNIDFSKPL